MAELVRIVGANNKLTGNGWYPQEANDTLSRILPSGGRSWDMVVAREGEPLLDAEVNLIQQIMGTKLDNFVQQLSITGWTKAPGYPVSQTDNLASGTSVKWDAANNKLDFLDDAWLVAKGNFIHINNPDFTGDADNIGFSIQNLPAAPPSGDTRHDFIFLEFWYQEIGPEGFVYIDTAARDIRKEGGVANGSFPQAPTGSVDDSLTDPVLNIETTRRVQLRWRFRYQTGAGTTNMFTTYPWGFTDNGGTYNPAIYAQGGTGAPVTTSANYHFYRVPSPAGLRDSSTGSVSSPQLLWRTKGLTVDTGLMTAANDLNTVDGYAYAVPVFHIIRTSATLSAIEMRQPSRMFIPDHSIHALQLAGSTHPGGPGVTGALSANGSVIEAESLKGGVGGDIGAHTITPYNLASGIIDEDSIVDGGVHIENINDDVGLPTRLLQNNTTDKVYNGSVVFITGNVFITPTVIDPANLPIVGVVENHVRGNPAVNYIDIGQVGWVRLAGFAAKTMVTAAGVLNSYLVPDAPSTSAGYYPAKTVADNVNTFGQVVQAYAHDAGDPAGIYRVDLLMSNEVIPNVSINDRKIVPASLTDASVAVANKDGGDEVYSMRRLGRYGTTHENDPQRAVPADDPRLNVNTPRPPTGPAGGDLVGSDYPNPVVAPGVITAAKMASDTITPTQINSAYKDGAQGVVSLRTLGGGVQQAAPGNHTHTLPTTLPPTGPAGGDLVGSNYPNPIIAPGVVSTGKLADLAVATAKLNDLAVTAAKIADANIITAKLANANVTEPKLANIAVSSRTIQGGAVDYTKIGVIPALRIRRISNPDGDQFFNSTGSPGYQTNVTQAILWVTSQIDTLAGLSLPQWSAGAPTIISVQVPGIYWLSLTVAWIDQGPGGRGDLTSIRGIGIGEVISNTSIAYDRVVPNNFNSYNAVQNCNTLYRFTAPTTLWCGVQQNSGVVQAIGGDNNWATVFQMAWVGPV